MEAEGVRKAKHNGQEGAPLLHEGEKSGDVREMC